MLASQFSFTDYVVGKVSQDEYVHPLLVLRLRETEEAESIPVEMSMFQAKVVDLLTQGYSFKGIVAQLRQEFPYECAEDDTESLLRDYVNHIYGRGVVTRSGLEAQVPKKLPEPPLSKKLKNFLFVKVPLYNPNKLLDVLEPLCSWMFSLPAVICNLVVATLIIATFMTSYSKLDLEAAFFEQMVQGYNWFFVICVLLVLKIPHEFAHALALRRAGERVHEMGFLFLVLSPCLYCDVSNMVFVKSKWKKVGVALAGVYADIMLTAVLALLYLSLPPGDLSVICRLAIYANLGFTMIINLIPLTRFDGHYALAYFWGRPYLGRDAADYLKTKYNWLTDQGDRASFEEGKPDRYLLGLFGVACIIYRIILTITITSYLYYIGSQVNLGLLLGGITLCSLLRLQQPFLSAIDKVR